MEIDLLLASISKLQNKEVKILDTNQAKKLLANLKIIKKNKVGEGSYGSVFRVKNREGKDLAMKIVNCDTKEEVVKQLIEVDSLLKVCLEKSRYINICTGFSIIRNKNGEYRCYYFLELAPSDMDKITINRDD